MKKKLKNVFLIIIIFLLSLSATGCGKKQDSASTDNIPINASGKVEIDTWRATEYKDLFWPYAFDFMEKNKKVKINYDQQDLEGYEQKTVNNIAEDFLPHVWSIPVDWLPDNQKKLVPIPEGLLGQDVRNVNLVKGNILPGADNDIHESIIVDNQVYGIPFLIDSLLIYYNPKLFREGFERWQNAHPRPNNEKPSEEELRIQNLLAGPPKTWSDLLEIVPLLTLRNGDKIEQSAIALGTADNLNHADDIVQLMIYQNGGEIVSDGIEKTAVFKASKVKENGELFYPAREALSLYASFSNPSKENYTWNKNLANAIDMFVQQKVAMIVDYPSLRERLVRDYPQFFADYAAIPLAPMIQVSTEKPVNFANYSVETVTKAAAAQGKVNLAWSWVMHYTSSASSKEISTTLSRPSSHKLITQERAQDPLGFISRQALTARITYKRHHEAFDDLFLKMIRDVTENNQSVDDAINQTNKLIDDLLLQP